MRARRLFDELVSARSEDRAAAFAGLSLEQNDDGIAILEFDQPGVEHNRFTAELMERLGQLLEEIRALAAEGSVRGLVITSAKPDSFLVGVDMRALAAVRKAAAAADAARLGQQVFAGLAGLPVPTVAAINGTCLGGATEMALACTYRLASDAAAVEIGLPEVKLGIVPGFGGTQRLPRLISLERALEIIVGGRTVSARDSRSIGLVDAVVPAPLLLAEARRWAAEAAAGDRRHGRGAGRRRSAPEDRPVLRRLRRAALESRALGRRLLFRRATNEIRRRTGGRFEAPLAAVELIREGMRLPLAEGLELEARRVGELLVSEAAGNLLGLFFTRQRLLRRARRATTGGGGRAGKIGVVGAGRAGADIARVAACSGVTVRLGDADRRALAESMRRAHQLFVSQRRDGRLGQKTVADCMGLIRPTPGRSGFRHCELVVEAVAESSKRETLEELEGVIGPNTVLATTASSSNLAVVSAGLRRPGRLVGLHFFEPVHRVQLVEVVAGEATETDAVDRAMSVAWRLGKVPVVVGDPPGSVVAAVGSAYRDEERILAAEGVARETISSALRSFGWSPARYPYLARSDADPEWHARRFGDRMQRRAAKSVPSDDIVDRCVLAMVNAGCRALGSAMAAAARDADLAFVLGLGFPAFRGGLFRYAQTRGLTAVAERLEELAERYGARFAPDPLLQQMASATRERFYPCDWPADA